MLQNQLRFFPSLKNKIQDSQLNNQQKKNLIQKIKTEIAVLLVQATFFVKSKNYQKAKQLFFYIADLCTTIKQPDSQVKKWIQISYGYIGLLHLYCQQNVESQNKSSQTIITKKPGLINLKYNKLVNQFEFVRETANKQTQQNTHVNQDLLKYVSKINSILFNQNNHNQHSSIFVMFVSYWLAFLLVSVSLVLSFVLLTKSEYFTNIIYNFQSFGPQILLGGFCIFPIVFIFIKSPYQKDNIFFEKKIGQCINFINQDCQKRGKSFQFIMQDKGKQILIIEKANENDSNQINSPCIQSINQQQKDFFSSVEKHQRPKKQTKCELNSIFIYDLSLHEKQQQK